ncbi:AAA family ATPase [Falsiroseomonas sp. HC035]|uniref:AAA family ATPase n=1 Tax=Falsiroseomonas sp. HC035 TaxID=3390999 RepID=UPI003D312534
MAGFPDITDEHVATIPHHPVQQDAARDAWPVVVELFGPAAAGKTTFARALHRALEAAGHQAEVVSSARPAERPASRPTSSLDRMLVAPMSRAAKVFGALAELRCPDPVGVELLAMFPPRSRIGHLRSRRYLARMHQTLSARRAPGRVVILDQGYLSAICSLAARSGCAGRAEGGLGAALDLVPPADLVVWVEAPREVVQARLRERLARQSAAERLFELDLATLMEQARLTDALRRLIARRGRAVLQVEGHPGPGPDQDVLRIAAAVRARIRPVPAEGAPT